jgi:hypothetical protein
LIGIAKKTGDWPVPPIGRVGHASDQAGFITGTTLLADGGMTAGYLQRERDSRDHQDLLPHAAVSGRPLRPPISHKSALVPLPSPAGPRGHGERRN